MNKKIAVTAVCFLVIGFMAIQTSWSSDAHSSYDGVLILQVGRGESIEATAGIVESYLNSYRQEVLEEDASQSSVCQMHDMNFGTIACSSAVRALRPLPTTSRIRVSLGDSLQELNQRRAAIVVVVAHGTPEGIVDGPHQIGWHELTDHLGQLQPHFVLFSTCYGGKASEFLENSWGFEGPIDAHIAGLVVSGLLVSGFGGQGGNAAHAILDEYLAQVARLALGLVEPELLSRPSWANTVWWTITAAGFVGFMILTLAPLSAAKTSTNAILAAMGKAALGYVFWVVFPAAIILLLSWLLGWNAWASALWTLIFQIVATAYSPWSPSLLSLNLAVRSASISAIFTGAFYAQFTGPWGWATKIALVTLLAAMVTSLLFDVLDLFGLWHLMPH